jgi:transcriptional regulator with XRE-family HTH domain
MATVTIKTGTGYIPDLKARMKKHNISQNALALEMGVSPSQASRWFTDNDKRRVLPELVTVERIEEAMTKLVRRRQRA